MATNDFEALRDCLLATRQRSTRCQRTETAGQTTQIGTFVPLSARHKPSTITGCQPANLALPFDPKGAPKTMSYPGTAHSSAPEPASYLIAAYACCSRAIARFDAENRYFEAQNSRFEAVRGVQVSKPLMQALGGSRGIKGWEGAWMLHRQNPTRRGTAHVWKNQTDRLTVR